MGNRRSRFFFFFLFQFGFYTEVSDALADFISITPEDNNNLFKLTDYILETYIHSNRFQRCGLKFRNFMRLDQGYFTNT